MAKRTDVIQQVSPASKFGYYYERGFWQCSSSPSGAHHWLIDASGLGQCKYCGEMRQFADSVVADYVDIDIGLPSQEVLTQESLQELIDHSLR